MNSFFKSAKLIFKRVHKFISAIINFVLIIPMYFIGAGLSRLFYKAPEEEPNPVSYWKDSKLSYKKQDFERLF